MDSVTDDKSSEVIVVPCGMSNASGISIVVVVSAEELDIPPGEANKEGVRSGIPEISCPRFTSVNVLSGVFLGNELNEERREVEDGGGGIGLGTAEFVELESILEFAANIKPVRKIKLRFIGC